MNKWVYSVHVEVFSADYFFSFCKPPTFISPFLPPQPPLTPMLSNWFESLHICDPCSYTPI